MHIRSAVVPSAIITIAIILSASAHAYPTAGARSVVADMAADVERDLQSRTGGGGAGGAGTLDFDPLQRARGELTAWTSVPSREELSRRLPSAPPGVAILGPGGTIKEYFPRIGANLTFPKNADTARAIRRMARLEVSAVPGYCARTVAEALGWGLGDAHDWTALPSRGYSQRPAGTPAQPGDIVVWPFSYGSRNSQHIGIAVGTGSGTRLLSNLSGDMGLTRILPGYRAYWKRAA